MARLKLLSVTRGGRKLCPCGFAARSEEDAWDKVAKYDGYKNALDAEARAPGWREALVVVPDTEPAPGASAKLDGAVDFWLNVLDELGEDDDPEEALAEKLGDPEAAERIWKRYTSLCEADLRRFLHALRTDEVAVRAWNEAWLLGLA